jgi:hypothetical protein
MNGHEQLKRSAAAKQDTGALRCRWCGFSTSKFYKNKEGKNKSGFGRLKNHLELAHPEELEELEEKANILAARNADRERSI